MAWRLAWFTLDEASWHRGEHDPAHRWNGFAMPRFARPAAEAVLESVGLTVEFDDVNTLWFLNEDEEEAHPLQADARGMYYMGHLGFTFEHRCSHAVTSCVR